MTTPQAADYLRNQITKDDFINTLKPNATLEERSYPVIIQFVPLTFDPSSPEQIQDLEMENGWTPGSVTMARWIKPPAKHATTQRVAHLLITLKDPKNANEGICDGITAKQK
ncbi:hypothetical protein DFH29DRAFT_880934 [Suillus ampliporus]|nr:hypothetical protein DFH29DRAFT_880934 [Suillus ampliporus]